MAVEQQITSPLDLNAIYRKNLLMFNLNGAGSEIDLEGVFSSWSTNYAYSAPDLDRIGDHIYQVKVSKASQYSLDTEEFIHALLAEYSLSDSKQLKPGEIIPTAAYRLAGRDVTREQRIIVQVTKFLQGENTFLCGYFDNGRGDVVKALLPDEPHPWPMDEQMRVARAVGLID